MAKKLITTWQARTVAPRDVGAYAFWKSPLYQFVRLKERGKGIKETIVRRPLPKPVVLPEERRAKDFYPRRLN